jgi:hypothetical protein
MRQGTRGVCGWVAWTGAWWSRFLLASAIAFGIATPAVALAASDSEQNANVPAETAAPASDSAATMHACTAAETCQRCAQEAAQQSQSQSDYQLGTSPATPVAPNEHPYTRSHYEPGAGHQD